MKGRAKASDGGAHGRKKMRERQEEEET